jgi:lauroyl/myristoyl acyltransferase
VPGFFIREAPGRYRGYVEEPLWPSGGTPADVEDLTRRAAAGLEKYIERFADQWYCFEAVWGAGS